MIHLEEHHPYHNLFDTSIEIKLKIYNNKHECNLVIVNSFIFLIYGDFRSYFENY